MELIIFVTIQFVNVFLSTIKSVLTVSGSRTSAAVVNAISYTIGAVITKLLTQQSFTVAIIVTFFANLIGVYLAKLLLDKTREERLWTIVATVKSDFVSEIEDQLRSRNIKYTMLPAKHERCLVHIYAYSKAESAMTKEIFENYQIKFSVSEVRTAL